MNWFQFIAAIVQSLVSLAWPIAFVVAVALCTGRLSQLLRFLRAMDKEAPTE
jgi:membrane protein implicated in regulation of membrane protease activity